MPDLHGWIGQQIDETERFARRAAGLCGCHSPKPSWSFRDGDEPTDGRILIVGEPHPSLKRKIGRKWNGSYEGLFMAEHIVRHDPEAVLRRCAADRKILARHRLNPDAYWADAAMCEGCGTEGEMGDAVTDNLNDCPELLDLGYAHGLTPEILAGLDRPQKGERPDYPGETGNVVHDSIASMYGALYKQVMETTFASISAAENLLVTGDPTVEPRVKVIDAAPSDWPTQYSHLSIPGWLYVDLTPQPTPGERAFAVVEPHLSALALYKPDTNPEA